MSKKLTPEYIINKSHAIHGKKYDYSKMIYINNHSPVTLICPTHGEFKLTIKAHVNKTQGCPECGIGIMKYKTKLLRSRKTHEKFLEQANSIHGNRYDYSKCNYIGGKVKMPIICKIHGEFYQHAENHINLKQGCLKCYHDSRKGKGGGGYALDYFEIHPEKREAPGTLYIARMEHKNDDFIKVGITQKGGAKERFYYKAMHGTVITPIHERHTTLFEAFTLEQDLLQKLESYRYFPNRKFGGYTECFKNNSEVLALIDKYLHER